jgi:acyl carrier protein
MGHTISTDDTLFNHVAKLIATTSDIPLEKITSESLFGDLGMDSLDAMALISDLELEYNIKIPNQELLKIRTVGQAVESLSKRIG